MEELRLRYREVRKRVEAAAAAAGRAPEDVRLLAAVKYAETEQINFLHREEGLCDVGENRVQTLLSHWEGLCDRENLRVHFIGSLQKNKVKYLIGKVCLIHSVDSVDLAREISRQAEKAGIIQDVLIEINSGLEQSKGGVSPGEAASLSLAVSQLGHVRLRGYMTMGPKYGNDAEYFANFSKTSQLALDIWKEKLHNIGIPILSMGMTDSLEPAIRAGADCVRIGRAIFGPKPAAETDNQ